MFDFVAKHKRLLQIILALTMVPFVFFGLDAYTRSGGNATDVARVDGTPVTAREFSDELRRQQDRLRQMLGAQADVSMLESPEMRQAIAESLVSQRLLTNEVAKGHLVASKEEVVALIMAAPEFQEGGKFSKAAYERLLMSQNMSPAMFENGLRRDMMMSQVGGALSEAGFAPKALAREVARIRSQQREVAQLVVPAEQFPTSIWPVLLNREAVVIEAAVQDGP